MYGQGIALERMKQRVDLLENIVLKLIGKKDLDEEELKELNKIKQK